MSDEKKPDPIEDVRKGLGLLFRAAKNAVAELPTGKVEEAVATGLREVGRAVESVASTIEREVFKGGAQPEKRETKEEHAVEAAAPSAENAPSPAPTTPTAPTEPEATTPSTDDHVRIDKT